MEALSSKPVKQEYWDYSGKTVLLGKLQVTVYMHVIEGRQGSYERGFKFTTNTYGKLYNPKTGEYSVNHGASWHAERDVMKSKGKVKIESSKRGEFAFDSIQKINRDYDPSFKWKA